MIGRPSRFVREAMERRTKAGLCPICGTELREPLMKKGEKFCPNFQDQRHAQARPHFKLKKVKK